MQDELHLNDKADHNNLIQRLVIILQKSDYYRIMSRNPK